MERKHSKIDKKLAEKLREKTKEKELNGKIIRKHGFKNS